MAQTVGRPARAAGGTGAARHRRANWPRNMVALEDFGKPPPPPPHVRATWQQIVRTTLIILAIIAALAVPLYFGQRAASDFWNRMEYLDKRVHPESAPALVVYEWRPA